MLRSMGLQRVARDLVIEQQQHYLFYEVKTFLSLVIPDVWRK